LIGDGLDGEEFVFWFGEGFAGNGLVRGAVADYGLTCFADAFLETAGAVVGSLADGGVGGEDWNLVPEGFGVVERLASGVVDGADVFGGLGLLSLLDDGGGDLKAVEHESGALGVHGFESEQAQDLSDGEDDRGGVLDGRNLDTGLPVHAVELHVEEAVRLALEGSGATAQSIVFDMAALVVHSSPFAGSW
jgi:hypothetical protein